mgnify:CR=1 FL=1
MTRQEISERYCVSAKVLDAYERCLAGNKDGQKCSAHHHYTEQDLAQISLLLTLHDLGFSSQEAQEYMRLCQCRHKTSRRRLAMLEKRRADFRGDPSEGKAVGSFGLSALSADALSKQCGFK